MKDMLFINGQLVDLGDDVNITLNYKSNMLTDLSKIAGNYSYTIKLPKTMRNLRIIGNSDIPAAVTSFPRAKHDCRYFRNGVEIIPNGKVVLMAVADSIEIVITWGNTSAFFKLVEDGKNLNEFGYVDDYIEWLSTNSVSEYDGTSKIMNADINFGLTGLSDKAAIHPSVRSTYVFDLIAEQYGLTFDFPDDRKPFIESLIIPLLTRNDGYANIGRTFGNIVLNEFTSQIAIQKMGEDFDSNFEWIGEADGGFFPPLQGQRDVYVVRAMKTGTVTVTPTFNSDEPDIVLYYGTGTLDNSEYLPYSTYRTPSIAYDRYDYSTPVEINVTEGDYIGFYTFRIVSANSLHLLYQFSMKKDEIQIGDRFPIVENLPDIKIIDFIKAVCSLVGLFAVPTADGSVLRFVPFDELQNKSNAVDWSDKLLPYDETNRPRNISYRLDDFARNNLFTWKDDDAVNAIPANGVILVDDMTLEFEREAVSLPFAYTNMRNGKAYINLYEYNSDGEPELQDVEPRLLVEKNVSGRSTGSFVELYWNILLADYYKTYQNAVKSPVLLVEHVRLDELSLRDFDVSKPVFLRQYGKYYAVVEMKAPSSGVCECKLLQLED